MKHFLKVLNYINISCRFYTMWSKFLCYIIGQFQTFVFPKTSTGILHKTTYYTILHWNYTRDSKRWWVNLLRDVHHYSPSRFPIKYSYLWIFFLAYLFCLPMIPSHGESLLKSAMHNYKPCFICLIKRQILNVSFHISLLLQRNFSVNKSVMQNKIMISCNKDIMLSN